MPDAIRSLLTPSPRVAVSTFFVLTGFISANWIARIPAAASALDLSTASLGTLLLFVGVGSILAFQFVGRLIERFGSARVTMTFGLIYAISLSGLALAPTPIVLGAALFVYGFTFGATDVAMNAQGVEVEKRLHKTIMGSLHGFFSLGALAGAAVSAGIASLGIGLAPHFLTFSVLGVLAVFWADRGQVPDGPATGAVKATPRKGPRFSLPPKSLQVLGMIAFCGALGEGAMADWSALFIHDELGGSEGVAAVGFAAFSTTMLIGRFGGDRVIERFGRVPVMRVAGIVSALGMLIGLVPGTVLAAIAGFAVMGLGLSVVIPIAYSAAGSTPGIPSGRAVAAVATIGYAGFLAGPPVLGWIAKLTSLQIALLLIAVCLVVIAFMALAMGRMHGTDAVVAADPESAAI
ncbi:MAG: MFS transporter [Thermomicrobiales bacterium]